MAESRTAVMAALLGNAALAVMKGVAAVSTRSAAMVAETFHSVADTGNQVLLFLGLRLSERPPDRAHGFGHGRDVYFWAFVVSLMLFSLGGAFSIWEGRAQAAARQSARGLALVVLCRAGGRVHFRVELARRGVARPRLGEGPQEPARVLA